MKTAHKTWLTCAALVAIALSFSAWKYGTPADNRAAGSPYGNQDTTLPKKKLQDKKEYHVGDLDEAMRELDRAMVDMDKTMKIDFSKMEQEMKRAMEEIKKVDFDKISHEVAASLKEINWEKTRSEVDKAMREAEKQIKEIDVDKMKHEIEEAKKNVDAEKIKAHVDIDKIKKNVDEGLTKARVGIEKAKKELTQMKEFINELDKDGLIDKNKSYKIEIKSNELYINGTKQSKEVNDKYRKYFKEEDYTIKSGAEM